MLLSAMATESSCRFKTWPRSRVVPGPLGGATHSRQQLGPLRPIVTAVPCPLPAKLILSRLENETALGKLLDANAYVEYVMANGR